MIKTAPVYQWNIKMGMAIAGSEERGGGFWVPIGYTQAVVAPTGGEHLEQGTGFSVSTYP